MSDDVPFVRTHPDGAERLPGGQHLTHKWPVLTCGPTPEVGVDDWRLRIFGAVEEEIELDWEALRRLEFVRLRTDFHCVTTWSKHDVAWGGFRVRDVLALARPLPAATHVMQHAYGGYTTNNPLEVLMDEDVLIVTEAEGGPLPVAHGGPARIVVPKRWAWKGAKWIHGLELMEGDRRGFWEANGYHNRADPWGPGGERFSHQEADG